MAHPKDNATFALFCDASDVGWSSILTQVETWDHVKSVIEQQHDLLTCKGGTFTGAQLHWSVTEKEAYPVVSACDDLYYLLLRPGGFKIFCDHRNSIYMFAPDPELKKHVRGKLLRWALKLAEYRYTFAHVEGDQDVWADLVSRCGGIKPVTTTHFKRLTQMQTQSKRQLLLRPLDKDSVVWPTLTKIAAIQTTYALDKPEGSTKDIYGIFRSNSKIWIPQAASGLIQRLFIISHCGPQGHRGEAVMLNHIKKMFTFEKMVQRTRRFLKSCLLCHHVKGGGVVPRPWGPLYRANKRNEAINWDFLFLGEVSGLLIIKDNFSHFCELVPCDSPVSAVAAEAMLWWHSRFGVPTTWISDCARHFKSDVLALLSKAMKVKQDFVIAYSPWLSGSVERINRDVLQVLRAMILEYSVSYQDWVYLIPLVQANLNQSPVLSLAGKAPIEIFTGLPCPSPISALFVPGYDPINVDTSITSMNESLTALRMAIAI